MTPFEFGKKFAADMQPAAPAPNPAPAVKQPMEKAVSTVAKGVPGMLNMARASGKNSLDILRPMEHSIKARTGEFPNNWERTEALMQGLPFPYPASK
jgi:hypothetical protein